MVTNLICLGSPPASGRADQPGGRGTASCTGWSGSAPAPWLDWAVNGILPSTVRLRICTRVVLFIRVALVEVRRLAAPAGLPLTLVRFGNNHQENGLMYWVMVLFASIGAALILGALTFVSALIGGLIKAMIVLMCGPLIDRMVARRQRRST